MTVLARTRNCRYLIPTNEKFIIKQDYKNITELSETTLRKTVVPPRTNILSDIAAISVITKSERIIRKPKSYLEEF